MAAAAAVGMIFGGVMNAIGNDIADKATQENILQNRDYYREQAANSALATQREIDIFTHDTDDLIGRQISSFGRAGVTMEGSPMLLIGQTMERRNRQIDAIKQMGYQNQALAIARANQAQKAADAIDEAGTWKFIGGMLGAGGQPASTYASIPEGSKPSGGPGGGDGSSPAPSSSGGTK